MSQVPSLVWPVAVSRTPGLWRALLLGLLLTAACKGPIGPTGPAGPQGGIGPTGLQGVIGPPGPGTRITFSGQLDGLGEVVVTLPAAAGTISDPPALTCYLSDLAAGTYLLISSDTFSGVACGFGTGGTGTLAVAIIGAPAFWFYAIVVVY